MVKFTEFKIFISKTRETSLLILYFEIIYVIFFYIALISNIFMKNLSFILGRAFT